MQPSIHNRLGRKVSLLGLATLALTLLGIGIEASPVWDDSLEHHLNQVQSSPTNHAPSLIAERHEAGLDTLDLYLDPRASILCGGFFKNTYLNSLESTRYLMGWHNRFSNGAVHTKFFNKEVAEENHPYGAYSLKKSEHATSSFPPSRATSRQPTRQNSGSSSDGSFHSTKSSGSGGFKTAPASPEKSPTSSPRHHRRDLIIGREEEEGPIWISGRAAVLAKAPAGKVSAAGNGGRKC